MISLSNKLIISRIKENTILAFKFIDDKIFGIYYCDANNIVGNIYVGIVSDVLKNINAAFIGFDKGLKGYYLINDNKPLYLNNKNTDKICQGDRILVQVSSDKVKTKDYTLTSNITFTGKYVVLTVGKTGINISRKISDNNLRKQIKEHFSCFQNEEYGFIIRTGCNLETLADAKKEASAFVENWIALKEKAMHITAGAIVSKTDSDIVSLSLENYHKDIDEIITDDKEILDALLSNEILAQSGIVRFYEDTGFSLSKMYNLDKIISGALSKKVWLKSGAYLVLEPTEALHVIDVNTGKADLKGNREDVFLKINLEAARAIALEIRKRNLSGIIIIDFINMKNEENNKLILEEMKRLVSTDYVTTTVVGLTNLGLMEITRKRIKKPLSELL